MSKTVTVTVGKSYLVVMGSTGSIGSITYNGGTTEYLIYRNENNPKQSGYLIINSITSSSITISMSTYGSWAGNVNEYFIFEL